jgi:enoyl-CoA hydratase
MSFSHIRFEVEGDGIAVTAIDRPEKLNALSGGVVEELEAAFERAAEEPAVRGVIVTGAGDKAFAAGADISELARLAPLEARAYSARGQRLFRQLETLGKPTVAAINGYALGGGLELAMACTVRFAAPHARLGLPEVKLGLIPGFGGTQRLPRLVGRGRALELMLSGEPVEAAEACRIGLVNAVAPDGELMRFSREWLRKVLANAPVAASLAMQAVEVGLEAGLEAGLQFETAAFALAAASDDGREGLRAFLDKRPPAFTGK